MKDSHRELDFSYWRSMDPCRGSSCWRKIQRKTFRLHPKISDVHVPCVISVIMLPSRTRFRIPKYWPCKRIHSLAAFRKNRKVCSIIGVLRLAQLEPKEQHVSKQQYVVAEGEHKTVYIDRSREKHIYGLEEDMWKKMKDERRETSGFQVEYDEQQRWGTESKRRKKGCRKEQNSYSEAAPWRKKVFTSWDCLGWR